MFHKNFFGRLFYAASSPILEYTSFLGPMLGSAHGCMCHAALRHAGCLGPWQAAALSSSMKSAATRLLFPSSLHRHKGLLNPSTAPSSYSSTNRATGTRISVTTQREHMTPRISLGIAKWVIANRDRRASFVVSVCVKNNAHLSSPSLCLFYLTHIFLPLETEVLDLWFVLGGGFVMR